MRGQANEKCMELLSQISVQNRRKKEDAEKFSLVLRNYLVTVIVITME
jgi:hypothetical protein